MRDTSSAITEPKTKQRQAYSGLKLRNFDRSVAVAKIFIACVTIWKNAFTFTLRTAVKYPDRQDVMEIGKSENEIARRDVMHRSSYKRLFPINPEKTNRMMDAKNPVTMACFMQTFILLSRSFGFSSPSASEIRRVVPKFIDEQAIVMKNPYTLEISENNPIASAPATLDM